MNSKYHVPNLERALKVIEYLSEHSEGKTQSEIVKELEIPKNSAFRITQTLHDFGYLEKEDDSKRLLLTNKLFRLKRNSFDQKHLVRVAIKELEALRDKIGETVLMCVFHQTHGIVLDQAVGTYTFKYLLEPGTECPLYCSAPGKAYLAYLTEQKLEETLDKIDFVRYNEKTITDKELLKNQLYEFRRLGYSWDEAEMNVGTHCIGAPVLDRQNKPIAAIWITGPAERIDKSQFDEYGKQVRKHANIISETLFF